MSISEQIRNLHHRISELNRELKNTKDNNKKQEIRDQIQDLLFEIDDLEDFE